MNNDEYLIEQKVIKTINTYRMFEKNDRVLIGVSGGIDSMCLLHILISLKSKLEIEIFSAHLNHSLRKNESDEDSNFVLDECKKNKIKLFFRKIDVLELSQRTKISLEEAGRKARYSFFSEVCYKYNINKVATAHNKCDQAETVLMRIIKGTGSEGLVGIKYVRKDGVVRPFLGLTRKEIEKYCNKNNIFYVEDDTNKDLNYLRNSVRHELIPSFKKYNPNIIESLSNLAKNIAPDVEFLNEYSERLYKRIVKKDKKSVAFHAPSFKLLSRSIQIKLIKIAISDMQIILDLKVKNNLMLNRNQINKIIDMIYEEKISRLDISKELNAQFQYDYLYFLSSFVQVENFEFLINIVLGDTYFINFIGKKVFFTLLGSEKYECKINEFIVDYDSLFDRKLMLRNYRKNDKISLYKNGSGKKISKFLIDKKIKRTARKKIPILCTENEVIAIVGVRISEVYKVSDNTKFKLLIRYENI
ncbi:MAG: tRNA lysidine(34) synthetase TilS [Clostridiales bacterium]|nr:tRNA lysidine(34) synthetase TilS [Clostridiales bacterium]